MPDTYYLVVEKGEPYNNCAQFELSPTATLIGRSWDTHQPEVAFTSLHISKRHALIQFVHNDNHFIITDLASKHGTEINDIALEPHTPWILNNGDVINLAKGAAVLRVEVVHDSNSGDTIDLEADNPLLPERAVDASQLSISIVRREVSLAGKKINLFGKDLELLLLLYQNRKKAVSYDQIKKVVWPERTPGPGSGTPDVGNNEINALIYRLRKRLEHYGCCIVSIPRYGYMLDVK